MSYVTIDYQVIIYPHKPNQCPPRHFWSHSKDHSWLDCSRTTTSTSQWPTSSSSEYHSSLPTPGIDPRLLDHIHRYCSHSIGCIETIRACMDINPTRMPTQIITLTEWRIAGLVTLTVDGMLHRRDHGSILKTHQRTCLNSREMPMKISTSKPWAGEVIDNKQIYMYKSIFKLNLPCTI